jgi:hypothetical protein
MGREVRLCWQDERQPCGMRHTGQADSWVWAAQPGWAVRGSRYEGPELCCTVNRREKGRETAATDLACTKGFLEVRALLW